MKKGQVSILIVDDEEKILEVIESLFLRAGYNVFKALNGNQVGSLFVEYVLSSKSGLTKEHYIVNTIVSADLAKAQAELQTSSVSLTA